MMYPGLVAVLMADVIASASELPVVTLKGDDTVITQSCRVEIPAGLIIEDRNGDGVIQIKAPGIVVEFAPQAVLRGAPARARPDEYKGYGIRITGQKGVTIRGAKLSGFWGGIWATQADGLVIEDADVSDNRRARLLSSPAEENREDWLYPHHNDANQWLTQYGAAIYIEDSSNVMVRRCRVRNGQNALCLDRVSGSQVYDNDFSFLSGWGIAMWRSSRNVVSRNALDFCIRGYSHGVYNRGQDSAGVLMFEQCCQNVIAENSATHGGDGFFGFAGPEALGQDPPPAADFDYRRRGCNDNLLVNNDFSYAAAHGIEMTFSFGNRLLGNRLVGNAICGVWGGYSQDTLIAGNAIEDNGGMGYRGVERGGVNIEHGRHNRILHNRFRGNRCAVHLWANAASQYKQNKWGQTNGTESKDNQVAGNTFTGDDLVFHLRGPGEVALGLNEVDGAKEEMRADDEHKVVRSNEPPERFEVPQHPVFGDRRPVGGRRQLAGRENIIMCEWGPWDHESPLIRRVEAKARSDVYELRGWPAGATVSARGEGVACTEVQPAATTDVRRFGVTCNGDGVFPYTLEVNSSSGSRGSDSATARGLLVATTWDATFFPWTVDPNTDLEGWRGQARADAAYSLRVEQLRFRHGRSGPPADPAGQKPRLKPDHFGMIARARLPMPKGRWKLSAVGNDGIRVIVDGKALIENWKPHGPVRDEAVLELAAPRTVEIVVEHYEIEGRSLLVFGLSGAD